MIEGKLSKQDAVMLLKKGTALTGKEPNILKLQDPVNIVGDIHGQFYDFCKLLRIGHNPKENKYLFLGDYVDRGCFSLEVVLVILALKISFPQNIYLLRGNHECR